MSEPSLQVVYTDPGGEGYHCVYHMARLAAELLEGDLVVVSPQHVRPLDKLGGILLPPKRLESDLPLNMPISRRPYFNLAD